MSSRFSIALSLPVLYLLLIGLVEAAWAHAYPASTTPADGSTVSESPREVRIQFTEGVELEFSQILVRNSAGEVVSQEKVRRISSDILAVDLKTLWPGSYTIEWRVLSVDTHITEGRLRFTLSPGGK
ncbi:MAG TPA: copper resistance CopC family protein [Candidatus Binatia bacterium]|jgi:methionine-rich copper-binding protein CopC|nr:copper resistance CopC family protein [Candidatus Binatia bacterium]